MEVRGKRGGGRFFDGRDLSLFKCKLFRREIIREYGGERVGWIVGDFLEGGRNYFVECGEGKGDFGWEEGFFFYYVIRGIGLIWVF